MLYLLPWLLFVQDSGKRKMSSNPVYAWSDDQSKKKSPEIGRKYT